MLVRALTSPERGAQGGQNYANVLRLMRRMREAVRAYEASLELAPGFVPSPLNGGLLYGELGDYERSIELLLRGLREAPGQVSFQSGLGYQLRCHGDRDRAGRHCRGYGKSGMG